MKKVALSLLAFALVGVAAFAEDAPVVKVGGYVNSGIKATKVDTADYVASSYANDYGAAGTWGKVSASVDTATYGAKATAQASDTAATVSIADAFVWYSPLAGLVIDAGTTYSKTSFDGLDDQSNDYFWHTGYGVTYTNGGLSLGANGGVAALGFGAAFAVDKMFAAHVTVDTVGTALANYEASVSVSAVDKLSLSAGYVSTANNTTAVNWADVTVGYAITDALSAGVTAYDKLTAEFFTVKPYASYVVAPGVTLSGYYQLYTEGKNKTANPSDNEVQGKVASAAGAGTLGAWVVYNTAAKQTVLEADYVISF